MKDKLNYSVKITALQKWGRIISVETLPLSFKQARTLFAILREVGTGMQAELWAGKKKLDSFTHKNFPTTTNEN